MFRSLTPVVKNLLIINVLFFLGTMAWEGNPGAGAEGGVAGFMAMGRGALAAYPPTSPLFYPVQVVTNIFMHADFRHLLFNMIGLYFFGSIVERAMGPQRFFGFYIASGIAGLLAFWVGGYALGTLGPYSSVWGASGAVYAIMLSVAYLAPDLRVQLLIPPIPIKMAYLAVGLVAFDVFRTYFGMGGNVATTAHIGGALFGLLMTMYWVKRGVIRA